MTEDKSVMRYKNEPPNENAAKTNNVSLVISEYHAAKEYNGGEPLWKTFVAAFEYYKQMNGRWVEPGGGKGEGRV